MLYRLQRADEKDIPKSGMNIPLSLRALQNIFIRGICGVHAPCQAGMLVQAVK